MTSQTHRGTATIELLALAACLAACGSKDDSGRTSAKAEPKTEAPREPKTETQSPPSPETKPEPAAPRGRLPVPATPDLAVVGTGSGVVVMDGDGKTVDTLLPGSVDWCRVDPRANVLWFHRGEGEAEALQLLDLETDDPPVTVIDQVAEVIVIGYPDEQVGRPEDHRFERGLLVHMEQPPRVEAILGCDGDMAWACFGDDVEDFDAARAERLARDRKELATHALVGAEVLAELVARSKGRRVTAPDPERSPAPQTVKGVPRDACEEAPEDCGTARRLTGSRLWLVVVGNSRGDFFHETVQLYDPVAEVFLDPRDPASSSRTPRPDDEGFVPSWVSPSGERMLGEHVLVELGKGTIASGISRACGFWGGGWSIETDV